jgi:glycosyltransferase involved in cell wall biosynthesis
MKLVVMIPAYNEEETIASVIKEIPREISGVDTVEVLVIDDSSSDRTVTVAYENGANKIISFKSHKGLAACFRAGLENALKMGADIIVNIDSDGQYDSMEIPGLIQPILHGKADVVLGSRTKGTIEYMPFGKIIGNRIATWVTRHMTGLPISDSQSGFRAYSRDAALYFNILGDFTYVQESLIQAANMGLVYDEVPISFRKRKNGSSRLVPNIFIYAWRAGIPIFRSYRDYHPFKTFLMIGLVFIIIAIIFGLGMFFHYIQTGAVYPYRFFEILVVIFLIIGIQTLILSLLADMFGRYRKSQDELMYKIKKIKDEMKYVKKD